MEQTGAGTIRLSGKMQHSSILKIIKSYDVILLDAYGVLVEGKTLCSGAAELIDYLNRNNREFYVVTNDASSLPSSICNRFATMNLHIPSEKIITSGSVIKSYYAEHDLKGARSVVLGPEDSVKYVEMAGGQIINYSNPFDVLLICDESGFPFLKVVDEVLSNALNMINKGHMPRLVLPNPDLTYPKGNGRIGITAGAIAAMMETVLSKKSGKRVLFDRLGKPYPEIFKSIIKKHKKQSLIMIGDQMETDIKGAMAAGIDSALVTAGNRDIKNKDGAEPNFFLSSLDLVEKN
jgi:HAD superfamily hydrolase (TIGR01450 family)